MSLEAKEYFEVAAGSVIGTRHVEMGKSNQDAFAFNAHAQNLVAVVADGCGSAPHSEIGAKLGARILVHTLLSLLEKDALADAERTLEQARTMLLASLTSTVAAMGGIAEETISDHFLFTILGVAFSGERGCLFSAGDGLAALGDEILRIGPFPGNEPPYLGYGLLGGQAPRFSLLRTFCSNDVPAVLLATDGATALVDAESRILPRGAGKVGPLCQFWQEDRYFSNPDAIRRRLSTMSRKIPRPRWAEERLEWDGGLLEDDTTILVLRRRRPGPI